MTGSGFRALTGPMLAASAMTTLGAVPVFLLSVQAVVIRSELGFDERAFGLVVGSFFIAAAAAATGSTPFVDRVGPRRSTVAAGSLAAACGWGLALFAHSYLALLVAMVGLGVANALLQLTANLLLAVRSPSQRRGLAFGVKQSAVPLALMIGGLAVPVLGVGVGWRASFSVVAAGGLLVAASGFLAHRHPVRATRRAGRQRPPARALLVTAVAMALASAAVNALTAFLPSWGHEVGLTASQAGMLVAVGGALAVLMRVWSGHAADRRGGRNFPVVCRQLAVGALGMAVLALGQMPWVVAGGLVALGVGWAWPGLLIFAVVRIGRDTPGAAAGLLQAGAFAGGAAGPILFGSLAASAGYPAAWLAAAVASALSAVILVRARAGFRRDLATRPLAAS